MIILQVDMAAVVLVSLMLVAVVMVLLGPEAIPAGASMKHQQLVDEGGNFRPMILPGSLWALFSHTI